MIETKHFLGGAVLFVAVLIVHTLMRELGVPAGWLPLRFFEWVGRGVENAYYQLGRALGWVWYVGCRFCNFVAIRLWDAVVKTAEDLYAAFKPYFHFSKIWEGIKEIGWEFWKNHRDAIRRGSVAIFAIAACLAPFWAPKLWLVFVATVTIADF